MSSRVVVEDLAAAPQVRASPLDRASRRIRVTGSQQTVLVSGAVRERAGVHCPDGGDNRLQLGEECIQALMRLIDGVGVAAGALRRGVQILGRRATTRRSRQGAGTIRKDPPGP